MIDSTTEAVVFPYGRLVITNVLLSSFFIEARTFTDPPRSPSLYFSTSIYPPVWKSGNRLNFFPCRYATDASHSSLKLCGKILEVRPTAIPSVPCASSSGNLAGSVTGSLFRPSYDGFHSVVLALKRTSRANFVKRASIYLGAAAPSPVCTFPQLP
ncbi:hypothetical protein SDC9_93747 [bioreactor metagenome]|uniref:Uncharacterized protein n=1 Tax=bioreactor metagenome TaxID=1076179 RepID=A0A645A1G6_9ZZZZ